MPTAATLRAGKAIIEVALLTKGIEPGLRRLQMRLRTVGASFARIGTLGIGGGAGFAGLPGLFVGGAAAAAAAWPVKLAANIELASAQMSVFTGDSESAKKQIIELQKFSAVAFQDVENLTTQMRLLMTRGISAEDAIEDIKALAVLAAGSTEEFQQLTKAFADVGSATRLNGEEMRQFKNTAFNPFVEIMKKTGETMDAVRKRMEAGGVSFEEVRYALRASVRAGGLFHGMLERISGTLIGQIRKAMAQLKLAVLPIGDAFLNFVKANFEVAKTIVAVAGILGLGLAAFVTFGLGMTIVSVAAGGIATAFSLLGAAFAPIMGLPGLLTVAFAGLAFEMIRNTEIGRTMAMSLAGWFGRLRTTAMTTFRGIADAMSAGDIQLAAQVLWAGLKLAWLEGTESLMNVWRNFKDIAIRTFIELSFEIQSVWVRLVAGLRATWGEFTRWFQDAWDVIVTALAKIGETEGVKAELDRMLAEKVGAREVGARREQEGIASQRDAELRAIEAARREAQNFQSQGFNEEVDKARMALEDARQKLKELSDASKVAAENMAGGEMFEGMPKFLQGALGTAKDIAAGKPQAFLDTRLARQMIGHNLDREQLDELRRIRKATENRGAGQIPVV